MVKNVDGFDVDSIMESVDIGYILEADFEYSNELHALHNDYQLAPEKLVIPCDMLPDYCRKITDEYGIKVGNAMKLTPNLVDKTNYVHHYRNIQLHLSIEMKLTKIHTVLNSSNLTG